MLAAGGLGPNHIGAEMGSDAGAPREHGGRGLVTAATFPLPAWVAPDPRAARRPAFRGLQFPGRSASPTLPRPGPRVPGRPTPNSGTRRVRAASSSSLPSGATVPRPAIPRQPGSPQAGDPRALTSWLRPRRRKERLTAAGLLPLSVKGRGHPPLRFQPSSPLVLPSSAILHLLTSCVKIREDRSVYRESF